MGKICADDTSASRPRKRKRQIACTTTEVEHESFRPGQNRTKAARYPRSPQAVEL
jgi:hypothetical protein